MPQRVAILVTDGFEEVELTSPREALEKAGASCFVLAPKAGEVQGFRHHDKSSRVKVDAEIASADPNDFDAVLLPGGVINGDALRIDPRAQQFVQAMDRAGKPIFVICHGGWLLVSAGLVRGRSMTSWPTLEDDIRNAGGDWHNRDLVRDRNLVSSRKPDDLPVFNRAITEVLGQSQRKGARSEERSEAR